MIILPEEHRTLAIWDATNWRRLRDMSERELLFWCGDDVHYAIYIRATSGYILALQDFFISGYPSQMAYLEWYLENIHPEWWRKYRVLLC